MAISQNINNLEKDKFAEDANGNTVVRIIPTSGTDINPLAKYVEAVYSSSDTVVTYNYYESSSKVTLYNSITVTYTEAQDTSFSSAAWS